MTTISYAEIMTKTLKKIMMEDELAIQRTHKHPSHTRNAMASKVADEAHCQAGELSGKTRQIGARMPT